MKSLRASMFFASLVSSLLVCGFAKAETVAIQNVPPNYLRDADGKEKGFFYDVVVELAKRSGVALSVEPQPLARISAALQNGDVDFAIRSDMQGVKTLGVVVPFPIIVVARPGVPLKSFQDLYNLGTISYTRGTAYDTPVQKDPKLKLNEEVDSQTALRKLIAGHTDAFYGAASGFLYQAGVEGKKGELGDVLTVGEGHFVLLASPKGAASPNCDRLIATLAAMRDDGTIKAIFGKYLNPDWSPL